MQRMVQRLRVLAAGSTLLAFSGCVTNQQVTDFVRTEFARITADVVAQLFDLFARATL